jgi:hypothetical protein
VSSDEKFLTLRKDERQSFSRVKWTQNSFFFVLFLLVSCCRSTWSLGMKAILSFETSGNINDATPRAKRPEFLITLLGKPEHSHLYLLSLQLSVCRLVCGTAVGTACTDRGYTWHCAASTACTDRGYMWHCSASTACTDRGYTWHCCGHCLY